MAKKDPDDAVTQWYSIGGDHVAFVVEVQRTMKRADICALYVALGKRSGPPEFATHNRGVVQALNEDEEDCIAANHKHADL